MLVWAHVSNAEVLQRSSLSTIGDILRHRRLSLFGDVACLDLGVPAYYALHLMVDTYEDRKPMASWRRPLGHPHVYSTRSRRMSTLYCCLHCGDLRSPGVTEWHSGPLALCDDYDDDRTFTTVASYIFCSCYLQISVQHQFCALAYISTSNSKQSKHTHTHVWPLFTFTCLLVLSTIN